MELSKQAASHTSVLHELKKLDEHPVLLNGQPVKANTCYRISGNPPQVLYNTNCPDELKEQIEAILLKYRSRESGVAYFYTVAFEHDSVFYNGRLTPVFKKGHDLPSSWHVVLNEVFFGYLHKNGEHWEASEQRPHELIEKIGTLIDRKEYAPHAV